MSTQRGSEGEAFASDYLAKLGFKILDRNWRTRYCEIDIVAKRDRAVHFVEVKYRQTYIAGTAVEYVTPQKLKQMHLAAEYWVHQHEWGGDYQLDVIAITGDLQLSNLDFIQNVATWSLLGKQRGAGARVF